MPSKLYKFSLRPNKEKKEHDPLIGVNRSRKPTDSKQFLDTECVHCKMSNFKACFFNLAQTFSPYTNTQYWGWSLICMREQFWNN